MDAPFFSNGNYIPGHPAYVLRSSDSKAFDKLLSRISFYILAPRQMGKTSLFKNIAHVLNQEGWMTCYIDLGAKGKMEAPTWFQSLAVMIGSRCKLKRDDIHVQNQADFEFFIQHQVGLFNNPECWLALFFDEVEGLLKNPDFSDEFLMTLRSLYQSQDEYQGRFFLGIAGCIDKDQLVKNPLISPMNILEEINLEDFTFEQTKELVSQFSTKDVRYQENLPRQIFSWTGGHPYLTHRFCNCLFDKVKGQKSLKITSSMVDEVVQESFNVDLLQDSNLAHFYHHVQELPWINSQIIQELLDEKLTTDYWYFKELYLLGAVRVKTMNCLSVKNELYRKVLEKLKARLSTKTTP
jgi:hypothetical protein